jgi:hypothetical protein
MDIAFLGWYQQILRAAELEDLAESHMQGTSNSYIHVPSSLSILDRSQGIHPIHRNRTLRKSNHTAKGMEDSLDIMEQPRCLTHSSAVDNNAFIPMSNRDCWDTTKHSNFRHSPATPGKVLYSNPAHHCTVR